MRLSPDSRKINEIFSMNSDSKYIIPVYQRDFSWRNENIEELFTDILNEDRGYYLGNLLVTPNSDNESFFDVVDGQQRLTTISLLLLGIYDILDDLIINSEQDSIDENNRRRANRIISDIPRQLLYDETDMEPSLELRGLNADLYKDLLNRMSDTQEFTPHKHRIMGKRYDYIQGLLKSEFIDDSPTNLAVEKINTFYDKLIFAELLRIKVDDLTDAFTIFTSFNAKGQPLTLIDLLKSYYLEKAVDVIDTNEAEEKWLALISIFYDDNSEPMSSDITQFLQNNYDAFENPTSSSVTKSKSLKAYQKLFRIKGEPYIRELTEHAQIYSLINNKLVNSAEIISNPKITEEILSYLTEIYNLEATTAFPFIMFMLRAYLNDQIDQNLMIDTLSYIKNYYVRRNLTLVPKSSNIRAKVLGALKEIKENQINLSDSLEIFKEKMNSIAVSDSEFAHALRQDIYDVNSKTARIILIDLERKYGSYFDPKQNPDTLDEEIGKNKKRWTLEHIMPQTKNLSSEWVEMLDTHDNYSEDDIIKEQQAHIHKIGNLTLTGYNAELSAKSFTSKRDYQSKDNKKYTGLRTPLYLNKSIPNEDESIDSKSHWNIKDINRRTEILAKAAEKLYQIF
ncbi:hypothetical protein AWM75_00170 [Aerococcus urinaehominis]|uniref:Uncharacterized protein n=1 Tax=Aerococcus urinaehominis TaxID=128944 RepID=A0A109RG40_9LACT|nr:DUF262 domain-containing protein [Aerococcus urinaehominis]AMB98500.1 hypothetical protein AWM75_00170 [Aerococcus urinaehominis]SDL80554.1 Uncharacterized conserved protein, contains ParB-like and HNH nuclease domains [Aerococcus urinaehominis]